MACGALPATIRPPAIDNPTPWRKARSEMTTHAEGTPRRLRATLIGLGLDGDDGHQRITTAEECLVVGGSAEAHAEFQETILRLQGELERIGRGLGDLTPPQLAEIAWRIDSPPLHRIAMNLVSGLSRTGRTFEESTAEELTAISAGLVP